MALVFVSRSILNPQFEKFYTYWCDKFPSVADNGPAHEALGVIKEMIRLNKELVDPSTMSEEDAKAQSIMTDEQKKAQREEDDVYLCNVAEDFMSSFKPFVTMLKKWDDRLLDQKECHFLHVLDIRSKWYPPLGSPPGTPAALSDVDKEYIKYFLNTVYLMCEIFIACPKSVMAKLSNLVKDLFNKMWIEKKEFPKKEFTDGAKAILADVEPDDVSVMSAYFWEFIVSKYTPILALSKGNKNAMLRTLIKAVQDEKGRKLILGQITPFVESIKNRVGPSDMIIDGDKESIEYAGKLAGDTPEAKAARKEEKERILVCIIDAVAEVLDERKEMVQQLMANPENGMELFFENLGPWLMKFSGLAGPTPEEQKKMVEVEQKRITDTYLSEGPQFKRKVKLVTGAAASAAVSTAAPSTTPSTAPAVTATSPPAPATAGVAGSTGGYGYMSRR